MAKLSSLAFRLSHEEGTTQVFEGVVATVVSGEVAIPGGANVEVEAEAVGFFVSIDVVVVDDQAYMTDPLSGAWQSLPAADLPFDFRDLGATLAGIVRAVDAPALGDGLEIDGVSTQGVTGTVSGGDLTALIPGADVDALLDVELWMDGDGLVRRVRLSDPPRGGRRRQRGPRAGLLRVRRAGERDGPAVARGCPHRRQPRDAAPP